MYILRSPRLSRLGIKYVANSHDWNHVCIYNKPCEECSTVFFLSDRYTSTENKVYHTLCFAA